MKTCDNCGMAHDGKDCPVCKWMKAGKKTVKRRSHRKPETPRGKVKNALRLLWLRSRERAEALKRAGYSCECCGAKQSKACGREVAVEVHHIDGIGVWEQAIDLILSSILVQPERLRVLCKSCHADEHAPKAVDTGDADSVSFAAMAEARDGMVPVDAAEREDGLC